MSDNPAKSPKPVILLAFANDRDDRVRYLRNLPEEARRLQRTLKAAERAGLCELLVRQNATVGDLLDVLQDAAYRDRIAIVHYGGHANGYQLLFETPGGAPAPADSASFAKLLGQQTGLELVFLNGCSTQRQTDDLLAAGVSSVIATSQAIDDAVATEFAERFYAGLGSGAALRGAFEEASAAVQAQKGTATRHLYMAKAGGGGEPAGTDSSAVDPAAADRLPWDLYVRPGAEVAAYWSLPEAARNPLFGLPELPQRDLPPSPYRHLDWHREEDAEVFFGRGREIRDLYQRITDPSGAPILLFYGQSGVGKSSLLAAGLLPRLASSHAHCYARREQSAGLLGTLYGALGGMELAAGSATAGIASVGDIASAWRAAEERAGKPLVVVLDQVEEVFTRPDPQQPAELEDFLAALQATFGDADHRPQGRLVLSFRKEWLAELEKHLDEHRLPRTEVFLERLNRAGIAEVVTGPASTPRLRAKYGLEVADHLPVLIADDLLADAGSAVAPTLQILLAKMWERARERDRNHPVFDRDLYDGLRTEGLGLSDFLDQQLAELAEAQPAAVSSGLALDVLAFHTTPLGTAEQRNMADLQQTYPHCYDTVAQLVRACQDLYLLVDPARNQPELAPASRLAHDTLAPIVRKRNSESDRPGQRARRILESRAVDWTAGRSGAVLDDADFAAVEAGRMGMRAFSADEARLVEASRAQSRKRRRDRNLWSTAAAVAALAIALTAGIAWILRGTLVKQEAIAQAGTLAMQARVALGRFPVRSTLLAVEAISSTWNVGAKPGEQRVGMADQALFEAMNTLEGRGLAGHAGAIEAVALSPDGHWLATASRDGKGRLWDATKPDKAPRILGRHGGPVNVLAFSPDGQWLATGSEDRTAWLWNVNDRGAAPIVLTGHQNGITSLAFSPDGRWLATASEDRTARLWDVAHPESPSRILAGHESAVSQLAFSPDGNWLATASEDHTARLWDLTPSVTESMQSDALSIQPVTATRQADGTSIILSGHTNGVTSVAISPDGHWLATGSEEMTARLWDLTQVGRTQSGATSPGATPRGATQPAPPSRVLAGHVDVVTAVAFSPDNRWLATASADATVRMWDVAQPEAPPRILAGHGNVVNAVRFSPDGKRLASSSRDGTARLWDLAQPQVPPKVIAASGDVVYSVAFSKDGRWMAIGSWDDSAALWDGTRPDTVPRAMASRENVAAAGSFSPDGRWLVTGGANNTAQLRDMQQPGAAPRILAGHKDALYVATFSPDSRWLATGSEDKTVRLWDMSQVASPTLSTAPLSTTTLLTAPLSTTTLSTTTLSTAPLTTRSLSTAPLSTTTLSTASLSSRSLSTAPLLLQGHEGAAYDVAFSPDGRWLATASDDGKARLWEVAHLANPPRVLSGHTGPINDIAFSPDGRWLATASDDHTARLWDLDSAQSGTSASGAPTSGTSTSGASASVASVRVLSGHTALLNAVAFSPDGRWLATGSEDETARLWDLSQPESAPRVLAGHENGVYDLAFSPDGRWLATGSEDNTARIWDVTQPDAAPKVLTGHENGIFAVAFSPDGRWLATGSWDETARLWDMANLQDMPRVLQGQESPVTAVVFSPDGRWLATGSTDHEAQLWLLDIASLVQEACRAAGRNLSRAEWQRYFPGQPDYHPTCADLPVPGRGSAAVATIVPFLSPAP